MFKTATKLEISLRRDCKSVIFIHMPYKISHPNQHTSIMCWYRQRMIFSVYKDDQYAFKIKKTCSIVEKFSVVTGNNTCDNWMKIDFDFI